MNPVGLWNPLAPCLQGFPDYVDAIVLFGAYGAIVIQQKVALVAAEVEHHLAAPVWTVELPVEVFEPAQLSDERTKRPLFGRATPQVNLLQHFRKPPRLCAQSAMALRPDAPRRGAGSDSFDGSIAPV